jgi:hypothetical protein
MEPENGVSESACYDRILEKGKNSESAEIDRIRHRTGVTFSGKVIHPLHPGRVLARLMSESYMGIKTPWEQKSHGKIMPRGFP